MQRDELERIYDEHAAYSASLFRRFAHCESDVWDLLQDWLMRDSLENSLALLPADQRLVVQLKLWEALTFSEIGEVLAISPNTASSRYRYGLSKLQESLEPLYNKLCAETNR